VRGSSPAQTPAGLSDLLQKYVGQEITLIAKENGQEKKFTVTVPRDFGNSASH
jgi:hypothetical protein